MKGLQPVSNSLAVEHTRADTPLLSPNEEPEQLCENFFPFSKQML